MCERTFIRFWLSFPLQDKRLSEIDKPLLEINIKKKNNWTEKKKKNTRDVNKSATGKRVLSRTKGRIS